MDLSNPCGLVHRASTASWSEGGRPFIIFQLKQGLPISLLGLFQRLLELRQYPLHALYFLGLFQSSLKHSFSVLCPVLRALPSILCESPRQF